MDELTITDSEEENDALPSSSQVVSNELPILKYKNQIIELVKETQVIIIQGHTGCGKTTKIPQFLLDEGLNKDRMIGITQPRRIAAISMAKRVSKERESPLGKEVGYEIRFDKKLGASTKIKYMTDGILLNECATSTYLKEYEIIMIDEAHERSVNSDVLLGLLKRIIGVRKDLKVLITSATISVEKFSKYFNDASTLVIEGRLFSIDVIYNKFHSNYLLQAVKKVEQIHHGSDDGNILVFLTGDDEIEDCCYRLGNLAKLIVKPLYGSLDFDVQQDVFTPVKPGERKVVVATNIAETSITIDGIRFVIDCGYVNQSNFITSRGIDTLEAVKISKAQADQRKGRAGRTAPGWCHRLYTKAIYDKFQDEVLPEIYRNNLSEIYIKLINLQVNPKEFEFVDRPDEEELNRSEQELLDLALIDKRGKLTGVGRSMIEIPVEPFLGKVLITSASNQCLLDTLKVMCMLSEKYIFNKPRNCEKEAEEKRRPFLDPDGDHFTYLNVYNEWVKNYPSKMDIYAGRESTINMNKYNTKKEHENAREWCRSNFIHFHSMQTVDKVFNQIFQMLGKKYSMGNSPADRQMIKRSVISGYFKNICVRQARGAYTQLYGRETLFINPKSSLFASQPPVVLFHGVRKTAKTFMHGVLRLDESIVKEFKRELDIINYPEDLNDLSAFP